MLQMIKEWWTGHVFNLCLLMMMQHGGWATLFKCEASMGTSHFMKKGPEPGLKTLRPCVGSHMCWKEIRLLGSLSKLSFSEILATVERNSCSPSFKSANWDDVPIWLGCAGGLKMAEMNPGSRNEQRMKSDVEMWPALSSWVGLLTTFSISAWLVDICIHGCRLSSVICFRFSLSYQ